MNLRKYFSAKPENLMLKKNNKLLVKSYIKAYFEKNNIPWEQFHLYDLEVEIIYKQRSHIMNHVTVMFVLNRPELLIGQYGRTIDGLEKYLKKMLTCYITIEFEEYDIWK